ncbi:MAG TPA: amidohydrolase family protein [Acidimicrobiia bacterium]|nr:amidohydrolase family protein [Acidimicrobiia bacterium]
MKTIDIHCHMSTPASRVPVAMHRRPRDEPYDYFMGEDSRAHNAVMYPAIAESLTNPAARIEHMDRMGIDLQGLATFVSEYSYWAPARAGAESSRIQNDNLAATVAANSDRFVGMGATVPMQDIDLAIAEMDRAIDDLGFKGLQIGGTINGRNLDEPRFRPFWAAVEAKGIPVILHPSGYTEGHRFGDYFLTNCIGNPLETMVAATRMIFSGLFEEHPGIKLVLLHGGGYLPFYSARADHTWEVRPETRIHIPDHNPSHYMRGLFYDTMVFQPLYLRHLIEVVGVDRVMLGTDFPFDMSEVDPRGLIAATDGITDEDRAEISGGNAARLFGIS